MEKGKGKGKRVGHHNKRGQSTLADTTLFQQRPSQFFWGPAGLLVKVPGRRKLGSADFQVLVENLLV